MKRSSLAIGVAALCAVLLVGCGRGVHRTSGGPAPSVSASVPVDNQLKSVDGLLKELDNQVNTDGSTPPDAD